MRFAVYATPPSDDPLTETAARWLGRNPFGNPVPPREPVPGFSQSDLDAITAEPRRYGFHATLKAPFRPASGVGEAEVLGATAALAGRLGPVVLPGLAVARLGRFFALVPAEPAPPVEALAAACVVALDPLRAPLHETERQRRERAGLTPRQTALFRRWGYPYVFEEFRFHMTLTGAVDDGTAARLQPVLEARFAAWRAAAVPIASLAVFLEPSPGAAFVVRDRFPLASGAASPLPRRSGPPGDCAAATHGAGWPGPPRSSLP